MDNICFSQAYSTIELSMNLPFSREITRTHGHRTSVVDPIVPQLARIISAHIEHAYSIVDINLSNFYF